MKSLISCRFIVLVCSQQSFTLHFLTLLVMIWMISLRLISVRGYFAEDFFDVDPHLGSKETLKETRGLFLNAGLLCCCTQGDSETLLTFTLSKLA